MHSVDFPESNFTFTKPKGWTDEQCSDVTCYLHKDPENPFVITAWQPNKEDLDALNRGEPIYMRTAGFGFVPTFMYTLDEDGNPNI